MDYRRNLNFLFCFDQLLLFDQILSQILEIENEIACSLLKDEIKTKSQNDKTKRQKDNLTNRQTDKKTNRQKDKKIIRQNDKTNRHLSSQNNLFIPELNKEL